MEKQCHPLVRRHRTLLYIYTHFILNGVINTCREHICLVCTTWSGNLKSYIVKVSYITIFMSQWDFVQPVSGPLPVQSWEPCVPQPSTFSGPYLRCLCVEVVPDGSKSTWLWAILTPLLPSNHFKARSLLPGGSKEFQGSRCLLWPCLHLGLAFSADCCPSCHPPPITSTVINKCLTSAYGVLSAFYWGLLNFRQCWHLWTSAK